MKDLPYISISKNRNMSKVNLDALIPREDFAITGHQENSNSQFPNIGILGLSSGLVLPFLKKPDFQRETSEWDKNNIYELLESITHNDLIPSIILWRSSSNYYFVLDGAHRLSALIAWYMDDYGDGELSKRFYNHDISPAQLEAAMKTRAFINRKLGSFKDIQKSANNPTANPKFREIAMQLGNGIPVQWQPGNADKAERSFFKINKQGAPLNPTERKLLESRKKPNCIAARAIIKRGKGHKYWAKFNDDMQAKITTLAEQIHDRLFLPPLIDKNQEIKSLELPIAGNLFSAQTLPLVYDFITISNNLDIKTLKDDDNGSKTVELLQNAQKLVYRINSKNTGSLGLHPAVYFYGSLGRHQPTAVLAVTELIMEFENLDYFRTFTKNKEIFVRREFEDFIIKYKSFFNQVTKKFGSGLKGYKHLKDMLWFIVKLIANDKKEDQILKSLATDKDFKFLNPNDTETETTNKKFTSSVKSGIFLKEALPAKMRCNICEGHIQSESIVSDHKIRIADGGKGNLKNGQLGHPYCNSVYKR